MDELFIVFVAQLFLGSGENVQNTVQLAYLLTRCIGQMWVILSLLLLQSKNIDVVHGMVIYKIK